MNLKLNPLSGLIFGLLALSTVSQAAQSNEVLTTSQTIESDADAISLKTDTPKLNKSAARFSKNIKRGIAAGPSIDSDTAEKMMSAELKSLRDTILATKKPQDVRNVLDRLESEFKDPSKLKPDYAFFAAQFLLLETFESIVWKMIPVASKHNIVHSALLTEVRNFAKNITVYFPSDNWRAGLAYVAEPLNAESKAFQNEAAIHDAVSSRLVARLTKAYRRINEIKIPSEGLVWDNRVLYGKMDSFPDDHYRYRRITETDRLVVLSQLSSALASTRQSLAYNLDGTFYAAELIGRVYGIDGFPGFGPPEGVTERDVSRELNKVRKKYPLFLTLRKPEGQAQMNRAYAAYEVAYKALSDAWGEVKNGRADATALINPNLFTGYYESVEASLGNMKAHLDGTAVGSHITGQKTTLDLKLFYTDSPADLLAFIPKPDAVDAFVEEKERCPTYAGANCARSQLVRNYKWGSVKNWPTAAYAKYIPEVGAGKQSVNDARKILSESSTFWSAAIPMSLIR